MALYRVTEYGRWFSPVVETRAVWWVDGGTGLSPLQMAALSADYADMCAESRQSYMHEDYTLYGLGIQQVRPVLLPELFFTAGFPVTGTSPGELMPTMVALVVNFRAFSTKPNRGRKYLSGFAEPQNVGGAPGVGSKGAAEAFAASIVDYHAEEPSEGVFGAAELVGDFEYNFNKFVSFSVKQQWGVQRRRRPGTGI